MSHYDASPTMREVAREAGFGLTTISLALSGNPKIPESTRKHVQEVAERMGYRPNPLVTAYQQQVKRNKPQRAQATIGWINDYPDEKFWWEHPLRAVVAARCKELGYVLDEIHLNGMENPDDPEFNVKRFLRVLKARGIHGVLLPELYRPNMTGENWEHVSVVLIGHYDGGLHVSVQAKETHVRYHQVAADVALNVWNAMEILRGRGFVRIGLAITDWWDGMNDSVGRARYLAQQSSWPLRERLAPWLLPSSILPWNDDAEVLFQQWFKKQRPDAILCCNREVRKWVRNLGEEKRVKVVHLAVSGDGPDCCGMDDCLSRQGIAAVDLLSAHMLRNERGLPDFPKKVLVPGVWREGIELNQ